MSSPDPEPILSYRHEPNPRPGLAWLFLLTSCAPALGFLIFNQLAGIRSARVFLSYAESAFPGLSLHGSLFLYLTLIMAIPAAVGLVFASLARRSFRACRAGLGRVGYSSAWIMICWNAMTLLGWIIIAIFMFSIS